MRGLLIARGSTGQDACVEAGGLKWTGDVALGEWIAPRLGSFGQVTSVVPRGFAAYARVLHPVGDPEEGATTWAAVCAVTERTPHALAQWQSISSPRVEDGSRRAPSRGRTWEGDEPAAGRLEPVALDSLCQVLAEHTAPGVECCFALWEGFGWIRGSPAVAFYRPPSGAASPDVAPAFEPAVMAGLRLDLPGRGYLLFTGVLGAATEMGWWPADNWFQAQSPNLMWPVDRSWCVATEIDFDSTVVAGSAALVEAVLAREGLEAWPVEPSDLLSIDGDAVNV